MSECTCVACLTYVCCVSDLPQALEELKRREEHANGLVQTLERTVLDLKTSKKSLVEELDQCRDDLKGT